jgi:putative iron-dependent peroxidase
MNDTSDLREHESDIQGFVGSAFPSLPHCVYLLLNIRVRSEARRWIGDCLRDNLIKSIADLGQEARAADLAAGRDGTLMLAFTFRGLDVLGIAESPDLPFPTVFKRGMADPIRAPQFGDDPATWRWRDVTPDPRSDDTIHILAAYFFGSASPALPARLQAGALSAAGLETIQRIESCPSYIDPVNSASYEPFGFRDGIGQPVIRGLRESRTVKENRRLAGALFDDRVVAAGEFLLGHVNEYGERSVCPEIDRAVANTGTSGPRFGLNGSYLAVRQVEQHVDAFLRLERPQRVSDGAESAGGGSTESHPATTDCASRPPSITEKMIGRRKDGCPLVQSPARASEIDAFRYRVADGAGFQCPRGAHVRRANPRDLLGWDEESGVAASKLHRIIRRGRVWASQKCIAGGDAACGDESYRKSDSAQRCGQGLFFIALNADLERQYEFIQQNWMMNRRFADLSNEQDPILGTASPPRFTIPAIPVGRTLEAADGLEEFTKVIGGGYFFLPGLAALRVIAAGPTPA